MTCHVCLTPLTSPITIDVETNHRIHEHCAIERFIGGRWAPIAIPYFTAWYALYPEAKANAHSLSTTHRRVASIRAPSQAAAFHLMQSEVWSPNGEARDLISSLGLSHTSMSVGDILVDRHGYGHLVASGFDFDFIGKVTP